MKRFSNLLAESLRFPPVTAVRQKSYTPLLQRCLERIFSYSRFPRTHTRPDSVERNVRKQEDTCAQHARTISVSGLTERRKRGGKHGERVDGRK